jgi:hypothetical protein
MDIDKQIAELDNDGSLIPSTPKAALVRISISFVISALLLYLIKPLYIINLTYDQVDESCKHKLNIKRFLLLSSIFTIVIYYIISKYNFIN